MKIAIICGTRPEIIKMAPVIRECERLKLDYYVVHTGQHYDDNLSGSFYSELQLQAPKYLLSIRKSSGTDQVADIILEVAKVYAQERPDVVLVQGDTNSAYAGAWVARRMGIKVGHIEACLRSRDKNMPEEINRVLIDHLADYLFIPTAEAVPVFANEDIRAEGFMVGNTIVDSLNWISGNNNKKTISPSQYILTTIHRQENTDDIERLKQIFMGLNKVAIKSKAPVVFPMHPRTAKIMEQNKLGDLLKDVQVVPPKGYVDFLIAEKHAKLIITDSGGIQEEACILGVPCVTVRDTTERPETLKIGCNVLVEADVRDILTGVKMMYKKKLGWYHPYGDGHAAERIIEIILSKFK